MRGICFTKLQLQGEHNGNMFRVFLEEQKCGNKPCAQSRNDIPLLQCFLFITLITTPIGKGVQSAGSQHLSHSKTTWSNKENLASHSRLFKECLDKVGFCPDKVLAAFTSCLGNTLPKRTSILTQRHPELHKLIINISTYHTTRGVPE